MPENLAPTLSEHLLRESQRFTLYPNRAYRTKTNLKIQELHDRVRRQIMNWRKTFMPSEHDGESLDLIATPTLLDEVYCRDLLREVPKIVERTLSLSKVSVAGIAPGDSLVYLREAANCFISGLPQAAIALARAAVESHLREKASALLGRQAVSEMDLVKLINDRRMASVLSSDLAKRAHVVRKAANQVLHPEPNAPAVTSELALHVVESARIVLSLKR